MALEIWRCGKCETMQTSKACENCSIHHATEYKGRDLTRNGMPDPKPGETAGANGNCKDVGARNRARKATNELLSDPSFDSSLEASRQRLENAFAIASELALRKAVNGMIDERDIEFLQTSAQTYRILQSTKQMKDPSEMTEAELAAAAGKK